LRERENEREKARRREKEGRRERRERERKNTNKRLSGEGINWHNWMYLILSFTRIQTQYLGLHHDETNIYYDIMRISEYALL